MNATPDFNQYKWQKFEMVDGDGTIIRMEQTILAYDFDYGTLDFLTRWGADGGSCPVHRHIASTSCIVLSGEQHFYDYIDGKWSDTPRIRRAGEHGFYTGPDTYPHRETGGNVGCVAFFSMHAPGPNAVMYEAFDDDMNVVAEVTLEMIVADFETHAK